MLALYERLGTWRSVAASLGISGGMAYRVALQGYEPHDPAIRKALGLPILTPVVANVPPGTIVMGRPVTCRCGRTFVGKWGERRKLCPVCRPLRQRPVDS